MIIDSHQHFWRIARGDYGWIPAGDPALDRDRLPADLAPRLAAAGVGATVLVQAAPALRETDYILGLADATETVAGVVGWIDFDDPAERATLERLARHPKFRGIRPLVQDIADPDWVLKPTIAWAFSAAIDLDLTFDALGFPVHIDRFARLFERYPELRAVVDHCAKPRIRDRAFEPWATALERLARSTGAFCKLSGLATEAGPGWRAEDLRPYVDHVLRVFGPARVMWGSDWPVLEGSGDYPTWLATARALVGADGAAEVFAGTARRFYRLP